MNILNRSTLNLYAAKFEGTKGHAALKGALDSWYKEASEANWKNPAELKAQYRTVSFVRDRTVFNISGNNHRLVVQIDYERGAVFIKWLGTHEEYDKIDVTEVNYGR